jgi:hypothetical protein
MFGWREGLLSMGAAFESGLLSVLACRGADSGLLDFFTRHFWLRIRPQIGWMGLGYWCLVGRAAVCCWGVAKRLLWMGELEWELLDGWMDGWLDRAAWIPPPRICMAT